MRIITLLTVFVFLFSTITAAEPEKSEIIIKGNKIPAFSLTSSSGEEITADKLKDKTTLIVFFATWCKPCLEELPHIQKQIWEKYKNNSNFKLIVIGRGHDNEELKVFMKEKGFNFPFAGDKDKSIFGKFAIQYIPRSYLIDKNGIVIMNTVGYEEATFEELKTQISLELSKVQ